VKVLAGAADQIFLNGIDDWAGGIHLMGSSFIWRWDAIKSTLIRS
jgi:hypothetical protein